MTVAHSEDHDLGGVAAAAAVHQLDQDGEHMAGDGAEAPAAYSRALGPIDSLQQQDAVVPH